MLTTGCEPITYVPQWNWYIYKPDPSVKVELSGNFITYTQQLDIYSIKLYYVGTDFMGIRIFENNIPQNINGTYIHIDNTSNNVQAYTYKNSVVIYSTHIIDGKEVIDNDTITLTSYTSKGIVMKSNIRDIFG